MWNTELKYGFGGGIALCAFKYIEHLPVFQTARIETGIYTGLFAFVIVITAVILGVKAKPREDQTTAFTFRNAFRTGIVIAIIMAILAAPFMYFYAKYINPLEAYHMVKYITENRDDGLPISQREIQQTLNYYKPSTRAIYTAQDIILAGLVVSLFSAGMFRNKYSLEQMDLEKKRKIPSTLKKALLMSGVLTLFTLLVYVAWILKYEGITSYLYDYLVDPISPLILQAGTALLALSSLVLNIVYYNRIRHYRRSTNIWNVLMIVICGGLFFILLWPIL